MDKITCSFCKDPLGESIHLRVGMIVGNWCIRCLAQKAVDLDKDLNELNQKLITVSLRGKELLKASKAVSDQNDRLQEKYMSALEDKFTEEAKTTA